MEKLKKIIIIISIVAGIGIVGCYLYFFHPEILTFATVSENTQSDEEVYTLENLEPGRYYVWTNQGNDIKTSIENASNNMFHILPEGSNNWKKNSDVNHTLWFSSKEDENIPTYYQGDELIYVSNTTVPFEGITWERFADEGYTIGVTNLIGDKSGHYRIPFSEDNLYAGYVFEDSDASQVNEYVNVTNLFLDKIGGVSVRDSIISEGGTILGLKKDDVYVCEWYTGTFYQDFNMTANIHTFCSMESFTTYNYNFLHSNCISIEIPSWFKSGYYYINGLGLFRYVSDADRDLFNGQAYDENVEWNDPIILYDELGQVIYDPSQNIDNRYVEDNSGSQPLKSDTQTSNETSNEDSINSNSSYDYNIPSDSGAEDEEVN